MAACTHGNEYTEYVNNDDLKLEHCPECDCVKFTAKRVGADEEGVGGSEIILTGTASVEA